MNGLVNFEKLRMLSQQIRVVKTYCQQTIMVRRERERMGKREEASVGREEGKREGGRKGRRRRKGGRDGGGGRGVE